ncbi:hypothetical protein [Carboxylicivirga sp. N1Y90]|uniref:hypothetical protein n=1 Tax=Carboxylicivirga fragile TaxID=3417571 RepID=UPI003D352AEF|nr:hypothetical protein [Marinilabiliaceae bacterium N1Y90]
MKQFGMLIIILVLCLLNGCTPKDEAYLSNKDKQAITIEVNQALDVWMDSPKVGWIEHILSGMQLTDDFAMVSDGNILKGTNSIEQYMSESSQYVEYIANVQTPERYVNVLSRDVAMISLTFTEDVHLKSGDVHKSKGGFQYVFKKIDNDWKVVGMAGTHIN